jgi:CBS domain-containing protein
MMDHMTVGELCIREVVFVRPDETVVDAAKLMRTYHVGDVVVVRDEGGRRKPVGMLTDRDLVVEVLAQAADKAPVLLVEDVATMDEIAMLREEDSAEQALATMLRHGIRRVPVVDVDGCLVGIVAQDDLLELLTGQMSRLAKIPEHQAEREQHRRP